MQKQVFHIVLLSTMMVFMTDCINGQREFSIIEKVPTIYQGLVVNGADGSFDNTGVEANNLSVGFAAYANNDYGYYAAGNNDGYRAFNNMGNGLKIDGNHGYAAYLTSPRSRTGAVVYISHEDDSHTDLEFGNNARISVADNMYVQLDADDSSVFLQSFHILNAAGTSIANINEGGNANFGGNVCASNISCSSDRRYKKNIRPLSKVLSNLQKINGVRYNWDQDKWAERNFTNESQIGFIAQELEEVYPELVVTDENGYKSVAYNKMTAILVEAVKELKKENDELKSKNEIIQEKLKTIDELEARLSIIERSY